MPEMSILVKTAYNILFPSRVLKSPWIEHAVGRNNIRPIRITEPLQDASGNMAPYAMDVHKIGLPPNNRLRHASRVTQRPGPDNGKCIRGRSCPTIFHVACIFLFQPEYTDLHVPKRNIARHRLYDSRNAATPMRKPARHYRSFHMVMPQLRTHIRIPMIHIRASVVASPPGCRQIASLHFPNSTYPLRHLRKSGMDAAPSHLSAPQPDRMVTYGCRRYCRLPAHFAVQAPPTGTSIIRSAGVYSKIMRYDSFFTIQK